ncbi:PIR Superfamily Protein [Plasmodium ovale wallikeri]|uniref:PIR Superfamily Protein n=2 Tax=Plasmodium ovale TaxID=36330 RepID=A0A1A8ZU01_PLAOA|nr:PIR Superfamily Protein [Plasmodium ovale wallikeri]SBT56656.1 PIR Superfamily Protein [Plasmodium ovale wallikeri]SBT74196.1 hypothetical protein POWCR01_000192500 [Plasmodium ovale]
MSEKPDDQIFDDLGKYELKKSQIYINSTENKDFLCVKILLHSSSSTDAVNICKRFVHFFTLLHSEYSDTETMGTSNKYPEFLNFWLIRPFIAKSISPTLKSNICQILKTHYYPFGTSNILDGKNKYYR